MKVSFMPSLLFGLFLTYAPLSLAQSWIIKQASWTTADEKKYADFVESIYDSGCNSVSGCMTGKGNWYASKDPKGLKWYADCGRFPYLLRAYFAYHNNLPFQSATSASKRNPNDPNSALQYTAQGNVITQRLVVQTGADAYSTIRRIVESVYTAVYRVDSRLDIATGQFGDMYHVRISREFIRPGTILYDPNGHVATVAKVTKEGKVYLLDSHPDNSVSRISYTGAFRATSPSQSGGFKNFRPLRLVGATSGTNGELLGGRVVTASNADSPGFSMEQFFGDQPNKGGGFSTASWNTSDGVLGSKQYVDVVRARLSVGNVSYDILKEVREEVETLCTMMEDRAISVQAAIRNGIHEKSMPGGRLPMNIYGTSGEWEEFSTPSRDARLKTAVSEFYDHVVRMVDLYKKRDRRAVYGGNDLIGDMLKTYDSTAAKCQLAYTNSDGQNVKVGFQSMIERLYAMSFDPYHCIELRWGATSSTELASCPSKGGEKMAWYQAEQRLRNSLERKYEKKMGWSLGDLQSRADMDSRNPDNSVGSDRQAPVNVRSYLLGNR